MNKAYNTIKTWLPVILWFCCIFLLSSDSFSSENTSRIIERLLRFIFPDISMRSIYIVHFLVRKAAHMTEYCIMSLLLFHSIRTTYKMQNYWHWILYSIVIVIFIAATDELHQWFVISRTSSIIDVGIDISGGILGQIISLIFFKRRSAKEVKTAVTG